MASSGCHGCFNVSDSCPVKRNLGADCSVKYNILGQRLCPHPYQFPDKCTANYNVLGQKVYKFDADCPCYPTRPTGYNLTCSFCDKCKKPDLCSNAKTSNFY